MPTTSVSAPSRPRRRAVPPPRSSVPTIVSWPASVPRLMSAALSSPGAAVGQQLVDHAAEVGLAAVADDGAVELGQRRPRHLRALAVAGLVAADERQRVAAARVGERDAGVGRGRQADRHAGHDLEGDALLVQEQRFFAAAVEEERIALLQPGHDLALAGLLGEQEADGVLVGVLTGRAADVDPLGVARRQVEHARMHRAVVDHHVGRFEAPLSAHGHEPRPAGPGADQIHQRFHVSVILSAALRESAAFRSLRSPARRRALARGAGVQLVAHDRRHAARRRCARAHRRRQARRRRRRGPGRWSRRSSPSSTSDAAASGRREVAAMARADDRRRDAAAAATPRRRPRPRCRSAGAPRRSASAASSALEPRPSRRPRR